MIAQEIGGVLHILESALQISRAEAGTGKESFEPVDVSAMMQDLCEIFGPLALAAKVRLELAGEGGLVIHGDRILLARAVSNLIDNAIKYGASGNVIFLRTERERGEIRIEVSDRSLGIPEERRAEALRKFGRLDHARSTPGSGLGLALVKAVASLHEGSFELLDHRPGLRAVIALPAGRPT